MSVKIISVILVILYLTSIDAKESKIINEIIISIYLKNLFYNAFRQSQAKLSLQ
jgi:hypothetical protein